MKYYSKGEKARFFESNAKYFKGVAKMKRLTACVHLEGESDKHFWGTLFKEYYPEGKFKFIASSKSISNRYASGVAHCLGYAPYLSKEFILCIDSDYRYLTRNKNISVDKFIIQTYTHSIENHYCFVNNINRALKLSGGGTNNIIDFNAFISRFSKIIYKLFIWKIYLIENGYNYSIRIVDVLSNMPFKSPINRGDEILDIIEKRVEIKLNKMNKKFPNVEIEHTYKKYSRLGLTPSNTYLFVRGHTIYDFVVMMGRNISRSLRDIHKIKHNKDSADYDNFFKNTISFESALLSSFDIKGYNQINKVAKDINKYKTYHR